MSFTLHFIGTSSIVESREEYNFNDAKSLEDERPRMAEMEGIPIEKLAIFFSKPCLVFVRCIGVRCDFELHTHSHHK